MRLRPHTFCSARCPAQSWKDCNALWSSLARHNHCDSVVVFLVRSHFNLILSYFDTRQHTMARFLTHECVAAGVFNADFECTASTTTMSPWNDTLKNNLPVLQLLLARMESDYVALPPKLKKPWNGRDTAAVHLFRTHVPHWGRDNILEINVFFCSTFYVTFWKEHLLRCCAMFQHLLEQFKAKYPAAFVNKESENLTKSLLGAIVHIRCYRVSCVVSFGPGRSCAMLSAEDV